MKYRLRLPPSAKMGDGVLTIIFLWTILQLWLNENVWNFYIHQKECTFLCFLLQLQKRKYLFLALIWYCSKSKHFNITVSVFWLPNQFRKHCTFKQQPLRGGGRYSIFPGRRKNITWVDLAFYGELWQPFRNHVILCYPYKFMSGYLYFPNNLKDHI